MERGGGRRFAAWCEASCIPVAAAWRCQDYVDNDARCYAGHLGLGADPALLERLREADVLLVVGGRLGDIETAGYSTIVPPGVGRTLIHVHPDPDEIGRVYEPALGIVASGLASRRRSRSSSRSTEAHGRRSSTPRTPPTSVPSRRDRLPGPSRRPA